jgi:hypothetical protein
MMIGIIRHAIKICVKTKAIAAQAVRALGSWGFQISERSVDEGAELVSPTHRLPLLSLSGSMPGAHFCWRLSRSQGHNQ